jgi:hypothetical protein
MTDLLDAIQHALCCPTGCKALEAGVIKDCAAKLTKEHAQAAIALCQEAYRDKIRALVAIQRQANELADMLAEPDNQPNRVALSKLVARGIAKLASEALK